MARVTPYLKFHGNCREAFEFYQSCLGGELDLQSVKDSPVAGNMGTEHQDAIMHGSLTSGDLMIYGSDMVMADRMTPGDTIQLCITGTQAEVKTAFEKLAEGGKITDPLSEKFFGSYGALTDKFGMGWIMQSNKPAA